MKQFKLFTGFFLFSFFAMVAAHAQLSATMGNGLFFRENKGQVMDQHRQARPDILFSGQVDGLTFHLDRKGMHYQLVKPSVQETKNALQSGEKHTQRSSQMDIYRVDIQWVGANPNPVVEYLNPLPGVEHFYNVPDGKAPVLNVKSYREVRYKNIYPGIDIRFYEKEGGLEYDFEVSAHANPENIHLAISGAELRVNEKQELCLKTPFGEIREGGLEVWQGEKRIKAKWNVDDENVRFQLGAYDPAKPLRIDPPVRVWGTYYGGGNAQFDLVSDISHTTIPQNAIVFSGATNSTTNISTTGSHQVSIGGGVNDVFLAKFREDGSRIWATYYGGSGSDLPSWNDFYTASVVDGNGNIYLAGSTESNNNIATSGSFMPSYTAGSQTLGFLVKFNESGIRQWGTYLGSGFTVISDAAVDATGNIYLTGVTGGASNIATSGTHKPVFSGTGTDAWVMCFSTTGARLWGTYFGGSRADLAKSISVNANGKIAIAGSTNSADGISTTNAHQTNYGGGIDGGVWKDDAFVAVFHANGTLNWATYYGAAGTNAALGKDGANAVVMDKMGNVYVTGYTGSNNMSTPGAFRELFRSYVTSRKDGFITKFDHLGKRVWGTYYGGPEGIEIQGIRLMNDMKIVIAGTTYTTSFQESNDIITSDAFKKDLNFQENGIFAVFDTAGKREYSTVYGGTLRDAIWGLDVTADGKIFLCGQARSSTGISTPGSFQPTFGSGQFNVDGFVVYFNWGNPLPLKLNSFAAYGLKNKVLLQWETSYESNTSHFELERKYNEQAVWSKIIEMVSVGNSNQSHQYQHIDHDVKLSGKYYYRLKMVDKDGSFTYSPVRLVLINDVSTWQVFPTIAVQKQVNIVMPTEGKVDLIDMNGRLIKRYKLAEGLQRLQLPYAAGQYRLINNETGEVKPVILQ
jgi:hypothetical protein